MEVAQKSEMHAPGNIYKDDKETTKVTKRGFYWDVVELISRDLDVARQVYPTCCLRTVLQPTTSVGL